MGGGGGGGGGGRGGEGGASTRDCDANATNGSPPIVVESAWISRTADEGNTSTVSAAATAASTRTKSPTPEFTSEDDIRLPDPPNVAAVIDQTAVEDALDAERQSPPPPPPPSAASPVIESAAQVEREKQPQLDLIHQAAILSSVFDDDDDAGAANAANAAAPDDVPSHLVFPSTSDAQPVTEPFDIQLLCPAEPFEAQKQDIVLSEHVAEISPAPEGQGAVGGGGEGGTQLLLTPSGTLVLSVDSNIVLLDHDQDVTLQQQLQQVQVQGEAHPAESLSMPIVSTESNGKTILWSSTAAPGDWPPKAGMHGRLQVL